MARAFVGGSGYYSNMFSNQVSGAVAQIEAALDVLAGVDLAALSATDLVGVAERYETLVRRHRVVCGDVAVELSRRSTAELQTERTGCRGQQDALIRMQPELGIAAPAVHCLFEITDDGKTGGGHSRWQIVDPAEHPVRQTHQQFVGRGINRAVLEGPIAATKFGHAVQHRAGRSQAQRREQDEPEKDTEHMAMRGQQGMFNRMSQQLGARQFTGVEVPPFR